MQRVPLARLDPSRSDVRVMETHISSIVFDGELVHKRKRAVVYPFIDLGTPARREATCRMEVDVNRRFSPDVYLGVEEVVDDEGNVVDHAVLMKRMPADRRLSTLVRDGADVSRCLRSVARIVAAAHARAERGPEIDSVATPDALRDLWSRSLDEMARFVPHPLDGSVLDEVRRSAERYLAGRAALLSGRIARGLIVDGHGDLLADDIFCLDDGPRILDALEFDERLRWGDVLADVAFLAMDLERLGRLDLGRALFDWYREFSDEVHPESLADHYVAYRALVRAKVACLRDGGGCAATAHLLQCRRHLLDSRVRLLLVGGLPGTGKSTLAGGVADRLGWAVLRSDEVRKELAGLDPLQPAPAAFERGIYSPARTDQTYDEMLARARRMLAGGESVILDASFASRSRRTAAAELAAACEADLIEVRCRLPADVAELRLARRSSDGADASDATPAIARQMAADFDDWPSAIDVGTLLPAEQLVDSLVARLRSEPGGG